MFRSMMAKTQIQRGPDSPSDDHVSDVHPWSAQRHDMGSACGDSSCSSSKHSQHLSAKSPASSSPAADGWNSRGSSPGPLDLQVDVHDWNPSSSGHSTSGAGCCCWESQAAPAASHSSQHSQKSYCQQQVQQQGRSVSIPATTVVPNSDSTPTSATCVLTPSTPAAMPFPCPTTHHRQQQQEQQQQAAEALLPARSSSSKFKQLALQLPCMARSMPNTCCIPSPPVDHGMDTCRSMPDDAPSACSLFPAGADHVGCNSMQQLYTLPLAVTVTAPAAAAQCAGDTAAVGGCKSMLLSVSSYLPGEMVRNNWSLSQFCLMRPLYRGETSSVHHAVDLLTNTQVALKVYNTRTMGTLNLHQVLREISVHSSLAHDNIIQFYAAFQEGEQLVMVLEYAEGGDLYSLMQRVGGRMAEEQTISLVLLPFLRALTYLHSRGILHRDIKPENLLFSSKGVLKVADFGLAINLNQERAVTRAGTLDYMAPEVLCCPPKVNPSDNKTIRQLQYNSSVDSWAVGILAYELLVGFPPFAANNATDSVAKIMSNQVVYPKRMGEAARAFIDEALSTYPGDRPTALEMLHSSWVKSCSVRGYYN